MLATLLTAACATSSLAAQTDDDAAPAPPLAATLPAAKTEPTPTGERLTDTDIAARRKQAEEVKDLDEELRKKCLEFYRLAAEQWQQAQELKSTAAKMKTAADEVANRVQNAKQDLEEYRDAEPVAPDFSTLPELSQALAKTELELNELKANYAKQETASVGRTNRRKEIRALLGTAPQRLEDVKKQLDALPSADEHPALALARRTELATRRMVLEQESSALQNELAMYEAEAASDLVRIESDLLAQQVDLTRRQVQLLNDLVQQKRNEVAREAVRQAQEEAIRAQPILSPYADENRLFTEETQEVTQQIATVTEDLKKVKDRLEGLKREVTQTKNKVESVGLTGAIGLMLRKQKAGLPDTRKRLTNVKDRRQVIDDAHFALFEYEDKRSALANLDPQVEKIMDKASPDLRPSERTRLETAATTVLERRRDYLDSLIRSYHTYFDTLVELDSTERQLIQMTEQYESFIDERVLWIRSGKPLFTELALEESDLWLISPTQWGLTVKRMVEDVQSKPIVWGIAFAVILGLFYSGRQLRRKIVACGEIAVRSSCDKILPTVKATLYTLLVAMLWPSLILFAGWRLGRIAGTEEFPRAVAYGLFTLGTIFLPLELMRHFCRPHGVAQSHFGWPGATVRDLRRHIRLLMSLGLPLMLVTATIHASDPEHGKDVVERCCFVAATLVLADFMRRILSPKTGVLREYIARHPKGWIDHLKYPIQWLGVMAPLGLAGLAVFGYYYTAVRLTQRMGVTVWFVIGLILTRAFLLRLVLILRRKLSIAESRRRRAEQKELLTGTATQTLGPHNIVTDQSRQEDLRAHSTQSQKLVVIGMFVVSLISVWWIWSDVVPALRFLDRWPLWQTTVVVTEQATDPDNPTQVVMQQREQIRDVTFADLGLAILIAGITFACAQNFPGLLEISVLQRLPLENSVRYAITTLSSYLLVLFGTVLACKAVGLRWSQIQWLATALTFGLAFGLQEMFANFVAGLIILFERPIRVGDVVTVDDVTGVVSRVRIRATTITNWDRKDFVVPNKEFITGKVLNWTLSDQTNRIVINVGLAYGADTELAREILLRIAQEHPLTLDTPPSMASFEGFGDSCLNFTLRTFLPSMENRLEVIHQLHTSIDQAFREANLEIAFPQRDLHLRTVPNGLLGMRQETEQSAEPVKAESKNGKRAAA